MGFDRSLQITLVILAPFAVIGCKYIFEILDRSLKLISQHVPVANPNLSLKFFGLFLMIFLLFNSGFMFQAAGEDTPPYCIALDKDNWELWNTYYQSEVSGAEWIKRYSRSEKISTLWTTSGLLTEYYKYDEDFVFFKYKTSHLPSDIPIYLGKIVAEKGKIPYKKEEKWVSYLELEESILYKEVLVKSNKIYDAGKCWIYYSI